MDQDWYTFLNTAEPEVIGIYAPTIENFLMPDAINQQKFLANYRIVENDGRAIYKATANLLDEVDLSDLGTKSVDLVSDASARPVGYPLWFIAAYPDVVIWATELVETDPERFERIMSIADAEDGLDEEGYINAPYLRKLVTAFKETGELETVG